MNGLYGIPDTKEVNLTIANEELLLAFIDRLSICPHVTVNVVIQTVGNITNSSVNLINANNTSRESMHIDCKIKKGLLR